MNRSLVFVAGPYSDPDPDEVHNNTLRAVLVGCLASDLGFVPFIPHLQGNAGVYGFAEGYPEPDAVRARAMLVSSTFAKLIGSELGQFWGIARPDGSLSTGTQQDLDAYRSGGGQIVLIRPWPAWETEIAIATRPAPSDQDLPR